MAELSTRASPEDGRSLAEVARVVGLTTSRLRAMVSADVLRPTRCGRGYAFSFTDLAWLRRIAALSPAPSVRELSAAMSAWRDRAGPTAVPSSVVWGLSRRAVVVRGPDGAWEPATGQVHLPLSPPAGHQAAATVRRALDEPSPPTPIGVVPRGPDLSVALREAAVLANADPAAARRAYGDILRVEPDQPEACLNLGRLLHDAGRLASARALYERAITADPDAATPWFNLGVVLEDLGVADDALRCYRRAIDRAPGHSDAHYNAARLCEHAGDRLGAVRHLTAYRRCRRPR